MATADKVSRGSRFQTVPHSKSAAVCNNQACSGKQGPDAIERRPRQPHIIDRRAAATDGGAHHLFARHGGLARANQVSLAFTSYQTGRLYLVGVDDAGGLAIHEVGTGRAMGLWADAQRLVLATAFQVWRFENILAPTRP